MSNWKQLNIYIAESDHWHHQPLHIALIETAKKQGVAGATVTRAIEGFSKYHQIRTTHLLELSFDLPLIVTIIDCEEVINDFLIIAKEMVKCGLITINDLEIVYSNYKN